MVRTLQGFKTHSPSQLRTTTVFFVVPPVGGGVPTHLTKSHDFKWSAGLWKEASEETLYLCVAVLVVYLGVGIVGFGVLEHWSLLDSVSVTRTTSEYPP